MRKSSEYEHSYTGNAVIRNNKIVGMDVCDYIEVLPDNRKFEVLDGSIYMKAPPSAVHQSICMYLSATIFHYIRSRKGPCRVYTAPFKVLLDGEDSWIEPDVSVICDRSKIRDDGCHGAPDWVIEVVSPNSGSKDYERNKVKYKQGGVREYWIVDRMRATVTVHQFEEGVPDITQEYSFADKIKVGIYDELEIDFEDLKEYLFSTNKRE